MRRGLWLIPLLALSFLAQLPLPVNAVSPVIEFQCNANAGNCTLGGVSSNSVVIVAFETHVGLGFCPASGLTSSSFTGGGLTFTMRQKGCAVSSEYNEISAIATATNSGGNLGATMITVAPGYSCAGNGCAVEIYSVTNINTFAMKAFPDSNIPNVVNNPATSMTDAVAGFDDGGAMTVTANVGATYPNNPTWAAPTGFTSYPNTCLPSPSQRWCLDSSYVIGTSASANLQNVYSFASSGDISDSNMVGLSIGVFGTVVVTTIAPCNFFQLQCWWYPLLFMGLYSGFILMVASRLSTSPRGKAHLFLSALTYGSLIAVIFGIMNIVFPLLMLILNTIIALRLRG